MTSPESIRTEFALATMEVRQRSHIYFRLVGDGERAWVACPNCRRLLTADEFVNEPCVPKGRMP